MAERSIVLRITGVRGQGHCLTSTRAFVGPRGMRFTRAVHARQFEGMKFFTPELYAKSNSPDQDVVSSAAREWDAAMERYETHLRWVTEDPQMKEFVASAQFHDAEVLEMREHVAERANWSVHRPETWPQDRRVRVFVICLKLDNTLSVVTYLLRRPASFVRHSDERVFPAGHRHWLYDEVQIDPVWVEEIGSTMRYRELPPPRPDFQHCILFSDGVELVVPFSDVFITTVPLSRICDDVAEKTLTES
jgi:hypothetical protein